MSRAGLVSILFIFAFIKVIVCAPLPGGLSRWVVHGIMGQPVGIQSPHFSLGEHHDDYKDDLLSRSLNGILPREIDNGASTFYAKRDYPLFLKSRDFDLGYGGPYSKEKSYDQHGIHGAGFSDEKHNYNSRRAEYDVLSLRRRSIGSKIRNAFKHGFNKVSQTFKKAANKVAQAGKKVGTFFKQNGLKIAKIGLKFIAAGATAAGKLVKFIPGVGTAVGTVLKGIAMGANMGSDKIHANLGGALSKISNGLNYVISPFGTGAKKLGAPGVKNILGSIF